MVTYKVEESVCLTEMLVFEHMKTHQSFCLLDAHTCFAMLRDHLLRCCNHCLLSVCQQHPYKHYKQLRGKPPCNPENQEQTEQDQKKMGSTRTRFLGNIIAMQS
jgi:hypothetical protein